MLSSVTLVARVSGAISTTLPASRSPEEEEVVQPLFSSSSSSSSGAAGVQSLCFCSTSVFATPFMRRTPLFAPSWFLSSSFSTPTTLFSPLHRFSALPRFVSFPPISPSSTTTRRTPSCTPQRRSPAEEKDSSVASLLLLPSATCGIVHEAWDLVWKERTWRGHRSSWWWWWRRKTDSAEASSGVRASSDPFRGGLSQERDVAGVWRSKDSSVSMSFVFSRPRLALVRGMCGGVGMLHSFSCAVGGGGGGGVLWPTTALCTTMRWVGSTSSSSSSSRSRNSTPLSGTTTSSTRRHASTSTGSSGGSSPRRPSGGGGGGGGGHHPNGRRMKARLSVGGGGTSRQGPGVPSFPLPHPATTTTTATTVSPPTAAASLSGGAVGGGLSSAAGSRSASAEAHGSSSRTGSATTTAAASEAAWFTTERKKTKKGGRGKRGKRAVILPGGVSVGEGGGGGGGGSAIPSLLSSVAPQEGILFPHSSSSSKRRRRGGGSSADGNGERGGRGGTSPEGATLLAGNGLQSSGLSSTSPSAVVAEALAVSGGGGGGGNRHSHNAIAATSHPHALKKSGRREKKWKTRKMRDAPQKSACVGAGKGEGITLTTTTTMSHSRSASASVGPLAPTSSAMGGATGDGHHRSQSSSSTSSTSRGSPPSPSWTTAGRQVLSSSPASRPSTSSMTSGNALLSSSSSSSTSVSVSGASLPASGKKKKKKIIKSIGGKKPFKLHKAHRVDGGGGGGGGEKNITGKASAEGVGKNALWMATPTTTSAAASPSGSTMRKTAESTGSGGSPTTTAGGGHGSGKSGSSSSSSSSSAPSGFTSPKKSLVQNNPLLFPDYREQVLRVFQQLLEVNNALGEVYKAKSYHFALQELRRGDHIFRVLPPNLIPLPREQANLSEWLSAHMELEAQHSDMIANWEKRVFLMDPSSVVSGMGDKLKAKIIEILQTGDLSELHAIYKRPEVSAMREICKVHGFGPRTALSLFRKHKIKTVGELKKLASSSSTSSGISLNDGQKLGLKYFDDIQRRIPHEEGKLHEAYLKSRLKKHFGSAFSLVVCGSFRRRTEYSGDIDILLTPRVGDSPSVSVKGGGGPSSSSSSASSALLVPPQNAVRAFVEALKEDEYIQATFALGSTKFMGMGRLSGTPPPAIGKAILLAEQLMREEEAKNCLSCGAEKSSSSGSVHASSKGTKGSPTIYPARRIDVRYVDALSFPAASLYFTGSKNFNVVMRARAVKMHLVLNEYGLFKQNFSAAAASASSAIGDGSSKGGSAGGSSARHSPLSSVNELITRLTKYTYWSRGAELLSSPTTGSASSSGGGSGSNRNSKGHSGGKKGKENEKKGGSACASDSNGLIVLDEAKQRDLRWLVKNLEYLRVPAASEQDIFTALGMVYVEPWERCW